MDNTTITPEVEQLVRNKEADYKYRERRQAEWDETYMLYRDKPTLNRLTQRQSVNIPLMKQTIKTMLKDIDDMPVVHLQNLDDDKQAELFFNEYWKDTIDHNVMEIQDIIDKRQVLLFGRSFCQQQVVDGRIKMTIQDPMDILVDRYADPHNIDSARHLEHINIFKTFSELEADEKYDQKEVAKLKEWLKSENAIKKLANNTDMLQAKNEKLRKLGVTDVDDPILGETYIELAMHFVYDKREKSDEEEYFLKVEAENRVLLLKKPLEEVIGETPDHYWRTHLPYDTWAEDIERQDFWCDGVGDVVRPSNKVLNAWYSQLVENRTLRNLNMNIYNSTIEGYTPETWEPRPWGMYGVPVPQGMNLDQVFKQLPVADLSESLDEMQYVVQMIEKATGATATQQGAQSERSITLGEVKLALGEAKERVKGMSKFYTQVWKERATKFVKLCEAAKDSLDPITIYKEGRNTDKIYSREIAPKDYNTKSMYRVKVWSQDEKQEMDNQKIEKLNAVVVNFPNNKKLIEIHKRKLLEFAGMTPDELQAVMDEEKQNVLNQANLLPGQNGAMMTQPGMQNLQLNQQSAQTV